MGWDGYLEILPTPGGHGRDVCHSQAHQVKQPWHAAHECWSPTNYIYAVLARGPSHGLAINYKTTCSSKDLVCMQTFSIDLYWPPRLHVDQKWCPSGFQEQFFVFLLSSPPVIFSKRDQWLKLFFFRNSHHGTDVDFPLQLLWNELPKSHCLHCSCAALILSYWWAVRGLHRRSTAMHWTAATQTSRAATMLGHLRKKTPGRGLW